MEEVRYGGWEHGLRLGHERLELVVTADVGPRVIRLGTPGGANLFKAFSEQLGRTGGDAWRIYGGHRLWHAPEQKPRTYAPDNAAVAHEWDGRTLKLVQDTEAATGIQKEIELTLDPGQPHVRVVHRLINRGPWDVTLAPWALSVMAPGGRLVVPQEPYRAHTEHLLPARPLVLWHYTDMSDPRWSWGRRFIRLRQDPERDTPQKLGLLNRQGWAAYLLDGQAFVKRFPAVDGAAYPDHGCNFETFTNAEMLEVESIGPLGPLPAGGGSVTHVEDWWLLPCACGDSEEELERALPPLLAACAPAGSGERG